MAPWPEVGERKAPDKEDKNNIIEDTPKIDLENTADCGPATETDQVSKPDEKEVLTLDEGQLKALLDEAMTYKNPKDREGKSELFNELLQEAEADEGNSKGSSLTGKLPRNYYNLPTRKRHNRLQGRECGVGVSTSRGGSLQNLHALGMEGSSRGARSRRSGRSNETLVSARQREGGSLPSNVNVDDIDSIICPNYTSRASLQVSETNTEDALYLPVGPVPNGIEPNSISSSDFDDYHVEFPTPVASFSCMGHGEVNDQHISMLSIPPSQLNTSPDDDNQLGSSEHKKLNTEFNRHNNAVSLPRNDLNVVPVIFQEPDDEMEVVGGLLGLPLTSQWRRLSSCAFFNFRELSRFAAQVSQSSENKAKSLDENGNALGVKSVDSNCYQDKKKQRRVKTKNDRNSRDFMSNDVEGFRGGADIDTLMEYIESPSNMLYGSKSNKTRTSSTTESRTMKRRTKEKFQRCNSLEEISKTKLKDLTEEGSSERINGSTLNLTKRKVTLDDAQVGTKSSWNDLATSPIKKSSGNKMEEGFQDSEFHIVKKKHRKKKRRAMNSESDRVGAKPVFCAHDRTLEYRHRHVSNIAPQPRRKSASSVPPSDKSDSSDLDSVHSLPVSSTTTRTRVGKSSVSGGSTPQASYADIARSVGSSHDIDREKCLPVYYCADSKPNLLLPASSSFKRDAMTDMTCDKPSLLNEEYPPLDVKPVDLLIDNFVKPKYVSHRDNKISDERVIVKTVPIKTVIPVPLNTNENVPETIDVPSPCVKNLVANLNSKRPPVILVDEPTIKPQIINELTFGFEVNQQLLECDKSDIFLTSPSMDPPRPSRSTSTRDYSLDRIVYFLNSAWESTLKDVETGRARYYDGQ